MILLLFFHAFCEIGNTQMLNSFDCKQLETPGLDSL